MNKEEKEVKKPNTMPIEELFTLKEVSGLYKMSSNDVRKLVNHGYIRYMLLGRIKVKSSEVNAFAEWAEGKNFDFQNGLT